jgi:hypothetical protein
LTAEWAEKFPEGINGKVCKFKVADGKVKYVMQTKKAAGSLPHGDDVFANSSVAPSEQGTSDAPTSPALQEMLQGLTEELKTL